MRIVTADPGLEPGSEVDGVAVPRDQEWPIGPGSIVRLARAEGLEGHARAVEVRLKQGT